MDLNRVLGALLGGAAQPPRRRRRAAPSLLGGRTVEARAARAIGALAAGAITEWMRRSPATPPPAPPPRPARSVDVRPPASPPSTPWRQPAPPPEPAPQGPDAEEAEALLLVRAMIAAAKSDGRVDAGERAAIAGQLDAAGLSAEERDFVLADFERPMTADALAREATDPMLRARLYAAAVAGAGAITAEERAWLDELAKALRLDKAAAAAIEERLA
jgi:uncharacterized membrane protein YebE (DUF533 family)